MSGSVKRFFAGAVLLVLSIATHSQQTPNNSVRTLLVNVLDRDGNAVRDLTGSPFVAESKIRLEIVNGAGKARKDVEVEYPRTVPAAK